MAIYTTELLTDRDYNIPEGRLPLEYAVDTANKAKTHSENAAAHVSADSIKNIVPIAWTNSEYLTMPTTTGGVAFGDGVKVTTGVAIGNYARQTRDAGIAIGHAAKSEAWDSIAIGHAAKSDGTFSVAIGEEVVASHQNTVAIGAKAQAPRNGGIAIGYRAEVLSDLCIAIGQGAGGGNGGGGQSIAIGYCAETGASSIAIGSHAIASGDSLALGDNARAMPNMGKGYAIGNGANCDSFRSMAIGHGATNKDDESLLLTASNASGLNFSMQLKAGFPTGMDGDLTEGSPFAEQNYLIFTVEDTLTGTKQTAMLSEINLFNMLKQFGAEMTFDKGGDGYYSGAENY